MNRPLVPAFLKKIDNNLLISKPNTWSTRVHLLVYYSILFCIAVGLFSFATFNDPRQYTQAEVPVMFTFLICFIGLVVWLIYLLRFNVFKRFGEDKIGNGIKTFLLFFTGFFFLVLPNYIPMIIESWKANMKYTGTELVRDANRINELIVLQNKAIIPTDWETDTLLLVDDNDKRLNKNQNTHAEDVAVAVVDTVYTEDYIFTPDYYYVDKEDLTNRLKNADSSLKLNDSLFVIARCPNLQFISAEKARVRVNEKYLKSKQLYDSIVKGNIAINPRELDNELQGLFKKYDYDTRSYYYDYSPQDLSFNAQMNRKYKIETVNSAIYNISDKKYTWDKENFPIYFRIIFYCSFFLSILLFIFRHSTVKTFFLSVLTVVVLMILAGLILTATRSTELGILGLILFYYVLAVIVLGISQGFKTRTLQGGISLNLVTTFTAFVPLFCVFYYYEYLQERYGYNYPEELFKNKDTHMLIAEIAGVVLFILLVEPVFKKLYRKWYALPDK